MPTSSPSAPYKRKRDQSDEVSLANTKRSRPSLQHQHSSRRASSQPPLTASSLKAVGRGPRSNPVESWLGLDRSKMEPVMPSTTFTSKSRSGRSRQSSRPPSTQSTFTSISTIYDPKIPDILQEAGVYPPGESELAENYGAIKERLEQPRKSVSPTLSAYETFFRRYQRATNEDEVKHTVVTPYFVRPDHLEYGYDRPLSELSPLTFPEQPKIPPPKPDYYTGAKRTDLNARVRRECANHVVPTKTAGPILVNQTLEIKGPDGTSRTALTQATYNGAAGARAMDSLRSFGRPETPCQTPDMRARSHSTTFVGGTMTFYATHTRPSQVNGLTKAYHINQIASEAATGSLPQFQKAYRMYRNQEDMAKEDRAEAITRAHTSLIAIEQDEELLDRSHDSPPRKRRATETNQSRDSPTPEDAEEESEEEPEEEFEDCNS